MKRVRIELFCSMSKIYSPLIEEKQLVFHVSRPLKAASFDPEATVLLIFFIVDFFFPLCDDIMLLRVVILVLVG